MREKEIDRGAQVRFGRRPLTLPAETHGLDHLRLVVPVLHGPRGPVRKFEPAPSVLILPARPEHAVKRLAAGIRVRVYTLTLLERPQVDDGRDVTLNGADTECLSDRGAIGA